MNSASTLWTWALPILLTAGTIASTLAIPAIREGIGKYVAGFVQHRFDQRIETLKSELRRNEEKFAAELRDNEQQLRSIAETALSLRSNRQVALDARRLQAVEKLWAAKIAADRMKMAAAIMSALKMDEIFKAAEKGDLRIKSFATMLDQLTGLDLKKDVPSMSAASERPFLPLNVWALFSAYTSVMLSSVVNLKALATGTTDYIKKDDALKPVMLAALPEYRDYIEKVGSSGYYPLLEVLEEKLLSAISEALEGRDADDATIARSSDIMSAVRKLDEERKVDIPVSMRGPTPPNPPKL